MRGMYFFNRRPRGFRHTFRFSSERSDLIEALRRGVPPEELARRSLDTEKAYGGIAAGRRRTAPGTMTWLAIIAIAMIAAMLLALAC